MSDEHLIEEIAEDALIEDQYDAEVVEEDADSDVASLYRDAEGKTAKIDTDKGTEGKDKKNKKKGRENLKKNGKENRDGGNSNINGKISKGNNRETITWFCCVLSSIFGTTLSSACGYPNALCQVKSSTGLAGA